MPHESDTPVPTGDLLVTDSPGLAAAEALRQGTDVLLIRLGETPVSALRPLQHLADEAGRKVFVLRPLRLRGAVAEGADPQSLTLTARLPGSFDPDRLGDLLDFALGSRAGRLVRVVEASAHRGDLALTARLGDSSLFHAHVAFGSERAELRLMASNSDDLVMEAADIASPNQLDHAVDAFRVAYDEDVEEIAPGALLIDQIPIQALIERVAGLRR